ncbi:glyoxalase [Vibrio sp. 10N.286.49.C2]|uniref:VOC family protein n=1 Tax=unclassified Vibrio TaxID=2614977 RepID=UPI000C848581|nr:MULTISPECIES: VOC family protein [unclassified Vibrio]PMH34805.1 glyoxalase [Vibrio sp. 10N.286.49.C2]PMH51407.1 glyoxalase [Vibrio sp. 10N.286.49.B1]PMH81814.1 glyoxalase [Vibrio sp. 10N.286.48.B7]
MISHIDHLVLTVSNLEESVRFYQRVLLMEPVSFANGRRAVKFGHQKINFQVLGQEPRNHARVGSGDLCLITCWTLAEVAAHLVKEEVEIVEGPVKKSGAKGEITSLYFLDPDSNLIEISCYW